LTFRKKFVTEPSGSPAGAPVSRAYQSDPQETSFQTVIASSGRQVRTQDIIEPHFFPPNFQIDTRQFAMSTQSSADNDMDLLYRSSGSPLPDRSTTQRVVATLHSDQSIRPPVSNVFGDGPLLLSDVPASCLQDGVVVGIDEAGRGSVLGPMIYGVAYWHPSQTATIPSDFADSKQLTDEIRTKLFAKLLHETPTLGFGIRIIHAHEISRNMTRSPPYNLNQMSHDAASKMIAQLLEAGVGVRTCYVDTVGNPQHYQRRLEREFPHISFVVESKADANYPPCSAASVGTYEYLDMTLDFTA
jgi:ribonuclease H